MASTPDGTYESNTAQQPAKGSAAKDWAAVIGASALLAVGGGAAGYALADVPDASEFAVSTQAEAAQLMISDPQDILSAEDEQRMERDAERLPHPDTVQTIHYIFLAEGRENVNDSVENFLRDNYPEQIGNDKFADGVLILGADMQSRNNFVFAGEDVADQLKIRKGQRLSDVLEEMKPGLRDNNLPAAVFAGANLAMDADAVQQWGADDAEGDRIGLALAGGGIPSGAALIGGSIAATRRDKRRKKINQARADHALLASEYTGLSQRLDELDVRANSVSSAFANAEMRQQWSEVRDRFLSLHDTTQRNSVATDQQAYESADNLRDAAQTFEDASHAEDNINRLFAVEQGDGAARRNLLTDIREDIVRAPHRGQGQRAQAGSCAAAGAGGLAGPEPGFAGVFGHLRPRARRLPGAAGRREAPRVQRRQGAQRAAHPAPDGPGLRVLRLRPLRGDGLLALLQRGGGAGGAVLVVELGREYVV